MNESASAILTYHSLDESGSAISTHPDLFREQIERFVELQIPIVPLRVAQQTPGSVALTFDDGYDNFLESGYPVLAKYGLPATIFVISGCCGRPFAWPWPQHSESKRLKFLSLSELRTLAECGIEIGSHTVHHDDLAQLTHERAEREIRDSRLQLEDALGRAIEAFAYPYGSCTTTVRNLVKRHFRLACGTSLGYLTRESDCFYLPRLEMHYLRRRHWYSRVLTPQGRAYIAFRRLFRDARGGVHRGSSRASIMESIGCGAEESGR